jgi:hypothetical protein
MGKMTTDPLPPQESIDQRDATSRQEENIKCLLNHERWARQQQILHHLRDPSIREITSRQEGKHEGSK